MKQLALALMAVCTLLSCKKETTQPFSAEGQWRGSLNVYHVVMVNQENGKSRIYVGAAVGDTASAGYIYDGNWKLAGNRYISTYYVGDSVVGLMESEQIVSGKMTGTGYFQQAALAFEIRKQPTQ